MFSGLMVNAWEAATIVAAVAGLVGFFTVMRGSAFAAHALPNGAFAGAAGAAVLGVSTLLGVAVFALAGALGIAALGRRARRDVATALAVVAMLALGALFLSLGGAYAPEVYSLLFGQVLGVSGSQLLPTAGLAAVCATGLAVLYRPLLLSSVGPEMAEARGIRPAAIETAFLLLLALATTMAVPVVGALLIFTLLVSPAAAARCLTARPGRAVLLSVALALATVWAAIALSYWTGYPVGFFVGAGGAAVYALSRLAGRLLPGRAG
ncbi:MAG TPA: metal ABC transporter permease [Acidimicrobiales bacterium]|nr:metal ABC transporter permease [Acidimicrobiales bacterium]